MFRVSAAIAIALFSVPAWASADFGHPDRCHISPEDIALDLASKGIVPSLPEAPSRRFAENDPDVRRIGEIILADLDVCQSGQDEQTCAYTLMGQRQGRGVYDFSFYGGPVVKRVSGLMSEKIAIPVFFTDFLTVESYGAVYLGIKNSVTGTGMPVENHSWIYGRSNDSALEGWISMNVWWSCAANAQYNFQDDCRDEAPFPTTYNSILNILSHEVGHRWGAGLRFRDRVSGALSNETIGRSGNHWSYWMNSRSPMEGNHWVDEGGGNFRVEHAPFVRFSDFDLYAMGLMAPEEVAPTFLIRPEGCPGQGHCTGSQAPVRTGDVTARGTRVDISIEDVIAAMGNRSPSVEDENKITRLAFVMARQKPGPGADTFGADDATIQKIENVRRAYSEHFYEATGTRARVTTTLSGRDDFPRWEFTISPEGWAASGAKGPPASLGGMVVVEAQSKGEVALIHDEVQLEASEYRSASVRVRVPSSAKGSKLRLSFGGIDGEVGKALEAAVRADGKVHEYVFDLRRSGAWTGTIGRLRIGLAGAPAGTKLAVDRFEISPRAATDSGPGAGGDDGGGCAAGVSTPSSLAILLVFGLVLARRRLRASVA